nr:RecName: Full=Colipase [Squalus acanthias]
APERGLFLNLSAGELCVGSFQCKSSCCQRETGLSLARCA